MITVNSTGFLGLQNVGEKHVFNWNLNGLFYILKSKMDSEKITIEIKGECKRFRIDMNGGKTKYSH